MTRFLPLALLFSATAFAADTSLAGTWTIKGSVQGVDYTDVCTLVQKDAAITGTCKGADEKTHDVTGTVATKTITFQHADTYQGDPLTLTYTGTIAEDGTMSGSVDVQPQNAGGDFTAKKAPPAP